MPTTPSVSRVLDRLAALRRRVRLLLATSGVLRLVAGIAVLAALWFLADRALDLPLGVRRFVRLGLLDRPEDVAALPWLAMLCVAGAGFLVAVRHRSPLASPFALVLA